MAKKYEQLEKAAEVLEKKSRKKVTDEEAQLLSRIGLSQAEGNAAARSSLLCYFDDVLSGDAISIEQARAALTILQNASTSGQKELCNQVLSRYMAQFPKAEPKPEPKSDKAEKAVAA